MDKIDIEKIRNDFPILKKKINDEKLIYLDNAATVQMPKDVLTACDNFYHDAYSNVHRSSHTLAIKATQIYETVRKKVQKFINAADTSEIIFTSGCTASLNLVALSWGESFISAGDEIVITAMEHHSNLIPWQQLALRKKAKLKFIELTPDGRLDMNDAVQKITSKTKLVAAVHVSNVLGVINPIKKLASLVHKVGAIMVVDGAQAVGHIPIDVQQLEADFYAFSGHKMLAPTGVGVLYGRKYLLEKMTPIMYGGEMIEHVSRFTSSWAEIPFKFEAGTPNIAGVRGLGAAIDYLNKISFQTITEYEQELTDYALNALNKITALTIYGPLTSKERLPIFSFNLDKIHAHDLATILDAEGVEVRAGHHCAEPLMTDLGVIATVRASLYIYNTEKDIDILVEAIEKAKDFFNHGN